MTSEKLYEILAFLDTLERRLSLQTNLEAVKTAMDNLVSSPANPPYQTQLANALKALTEATEQLRGTITPSQQSALDAMGGSKFFDPGMAEEIEGNIQLNAMTPTVARDSIQEFTNERAKFLTTFRKAKDSLSALGINAESLPPGGADLAFSIPRDIFNNELERFVKELGFISRLMKDYSEAATGEIDNVKLEQLSSSIPTIALAAKTSVINLVATAVDKFLGAWKKVEEIRLLRAKVAEIGVSKTALEEMDDQITTTVEEVVEETTQLVLSTYPGNDQGRENELRNAVREDTRRLFGQIERGLTVEFRAEADSKGDEDSEEHKTLVRIGELGRTMTFPHRSRNPLLLQEPALIEGKVESFKHTRKTTTTTRKTTKKEKTGTAEQT
jgi:hypothetical protein